MSRICPLSGNADQSYHCAVCAQSSPLLPLIFSIIFYLKCLHITSTKICIKWWSFPFPTFCSKWLLTHFTIFYLICFHCIRHKMTVHSFLYILHKIPTHFFQHAVGGHPRDSVIKERRRHNHFDNRAFIQ